MGIRERLSGNEAVANAMRQIDPDVVAAFPITPSTEIPQYFSTFVNIKLDKYIWLEKKWIKLTKMTLSVIMSTK